MSLVFPFRFILQRDEILHHPRDNGSPWFQIGAKRISFLHSIFQGPVPEPGGLGDAEAKEEGANRCASDANVPQLKAMGVSAQTASWGGLGAAFREGPGGLQRVLELLEKYHLGLFPPFWCQKRGTTRPDDVAWVCCLDSPIVCVQDWCAKKGPKWFCFSWQHVHG